MVDFQDKRVQIQELNQIQRKTRIYFFKGTSSFCSPFLSLEQLTSILVKNMLGFCANIIKGVSTVALCSESYRFLAD